MKNETTKNQFQIIDNYEDFCSLKMEWDHLLNSYSSPNVFLTHDWIHCWLMVFRNQGQLLIIVHREDGKINFIAPLMRSKRKYFRYLKKNTIHFIGIERSDRNGFIYSHSGKKLVIPCIQYIFNRFKKDIIYLNDVEIEFFQEINSFLQSSNNNFNFFFYEGKQLLLYLANVNTKLLNKRDIRYNTNRLKRQGKLSYKKITKFSDVHKILTELFEHHTQNWLNKGDALFIDKRNQMFYQLLTGKMFEDNVIHLSAMYLNQIIIAIHLGFSYNDTLYYYKPTYNNKYINYSPGSILLLNLIKDAHESHKLIDFGRGEELYKKRFTNNSRITKTIYITNKHSLNTLIILLIKLRRHKNKS